jgi:tetraacyldisaccharide 4'-kinase
LELRVLDEVIHTDHHRYVKNDIAGLRARAIELRAELLITTEKDAAKLAALLDSADTNWWAIRLEPVVTVGEERLRRLIMDGAAMGTTEVCA